MESRMTDGTGRALIEFLDRAAERGWLNKNTALGYRSASQKILEVENDWEEAKLSAIDVESLFRRFENLRGGEYSPKSLETYRSRFQNAIQTYLEWASNPSGWKLPSPTRRKRAEGTSPAQLEGEEASKTRQEKLQAPRPSASSGMITYPFPLREDVDAQLVLPRDLKAEEARRLVAFINALSFEEPAC